MQKTENLKKVQPTTIIFRYFDLAVNNKDVQKFIKELDTLCDKYAVAQTVNYSYITEQ
jgi:hypothetical protein